VKGGYQPQSAALHVGTKIFSDFDQSGDFRIANRSKLTVATLVMKL
jgi:hypothetical protein